MENKYYRKKIKNTDFTILTPNCMAGLIYHRLGERFNSPTIDLSINTTDFCYFLEYFDYYISKDVTECKDDHSKECPIGIIEGDNCKIPDIKVYFIHYESFDTAREKWNTRKSRIQKDNMYVIMCDIGDINELDYDKAGYIIQEDYNKFLNFKCNNKIILTRDPDKKDMENYLYVKPEYKKPNPLVYMNRDIIGLDKFEKEFNFVEFLNKR